MKTYKVLFDTVIEGRHQHPGQEVTLTDDRAAGYLSAGLIEAIGSEEPKEKAPKKKD